MDIKNIKDKLTDALPAYLRNEDETPEDKKQQDAVASTSGII